MANRPQHIEQYLKECRAQDKACGYDIILDEVKLYLSQSKEGKALVECAEKNDIPILFYHATADMQKQKVAAFYNASVGAVFLPTQFTSQIRVKSKNAVSVTEYEDLKPLIFHLAHELRHAWQHVHGLFPHDGQGAEPEDAMVWMRFLEADAMAMETRVARELSRLDQGAWGDMSSPFFGIWGVYGAEKGFPVISKWEECEGRFKPANDHCATEDKKTLSPEIYRMATKGIFKSFFNSKAKGFDYKSFYDKRIMRAYLNRGREKSFLPVKNVSGIPVFPSAFALRDVRREENLKRFGVLASDMTKNYLENDGGQACDTTPLTDPYYTENLSLSARLMFARVAVKTTTQKWRAKVFGSRKKSNSSQNSFIA